MSDPESDSIQLSLLEARRAFQSKLQVIPSAYSLDGRSFSFTCPVGTDIDPGRYVRIGVPEQGDLIAQVYETEVEELESSELRLDNVSDQGVGLPGVEVGQARSGCGAPA